MKINFHCGCRGSDSLTRETDAAPCALELRRGSALLIVLGFLSFMMISSVSFAIYMRIERQASSNYRHATAGRHLLNSALYRAIDEIDSELRVSQVTDRNGTVDLRSIKFPEWPGRTKPSAVPNGLDNGNDARVLSLEALSFIPGILVNDVRRYAVSNRYDVVKGVNATQKKYSYLGAKWRPLSMPVSSIVGGENAYEEAVVGRYSYVCVNVSDMLNVNECPASVRTNGVSIGHLFGAETPSVDQLRKTFDENLMNEDFNYSTLQDFYACMYERGDTTFGSPYHEYANGGSNTRADGSFSPQGGMNASIGANVVVTDGIIKPEPVRSVPGANLSIRNPPNALSAATAAFAAQLAKVTTLSTGSSANDTMFFKSMLTDYLDEDSEPYFASGSGISGLYRPSVEMTPQIFQIFIKPNDPALIPKIVPGTAVAAGGSGSGTVTPYSLRLADPTKGPVSVTIQTMFPFKDWEVRKQKEPNNFAFTLDAQAFLVLVPGAADLTTGALGSPLLNLTPSPTKCFKLRLNPGSSSLTPLPSGENETIKLCVASFDIGPCDIPVFSLTDTGAFSSWDAPFQENMPVRIALVVFAGIKQNNKLVDMVPGYWNPKGPCPTDLNAAISDIMPIPSICDRLFFQTDDFPISRATAAGTPLNMPYEWSSLEVPDPRYNHKASNWIQGRNPAAGSLAATLSQQVVGKEGRDNDVYQFVSNGRRLLSAGEFGFLPRPYSDPNKMGNNVPLKGNDTVDKAEDYRHMFRTVRLYDYTDDPKYKSDDVYAYFPAGSPNTILTGGRVNPCSDLPQVLSAAVTGVPVNYWVGTLDPSSPNDRKLMLTKTFSRIMPARDWASFTNGWMQCLINARRVSQFSRQWNVSVSDVYGRLNLFGWHVEGQPDSIFDTRGSFSATGVPASLTKPLHEIDRKTLFSYSQEAFCDRQQLFLYFLRAEVTVPSFGTTQESGTRSLAGGRAVALVWRDPYPAGYDKATDTWFGKGVNPSPWYSTLNRISPWYQVNLKYYSEQYDADLNSDDTFSGTRRRLDGYHDHRILYFKQLDN